MVFQERMWQPGLGWWWWRWKGMGAICGLCEQQGLGVGRKKRGLDSQISVF